MDFPLRGIYTKMALDMELCDGGQGTVGQKDNREIPSCLISKHIYQPSHLHSPRITFQGIPRGLRDWLETQEPVSGISSLPYQRWLKSAREV